jgi:spore maturation protein CgeB
MRFACYGSSLVSADWNRPAPYYRGLLKALAERGHSILFAEPDAFDRLSHRDIDEPVWAEVLAYAPNESGMSRALARAAGADVIVKFSGVGVLDAELERAVLALRRPGQMTIFWDVDAPATLDRMENRNHDPLRALVPRFDAIFTYGGGNAVVRAYRRFACRFTMRLIRRHIIRLHPIRDLLPISPFWAIGCPAAKRGSKNSS